MSKRKQMELFEDDTPKPAKKKATLEGSFAIREEKIIYLDDTNDGPYAMVHIDGVGALKVAKEKLQIIGGKREFNY